jgi:hypothetical protein
MEAVASDCRSRKSAISHAWETSFYATSRYSPRIHFMGQELD